MILVPRTWPVAGLMAMLALVAPAVMAQDNAASDITAEAAKKNEKSFEIYGFAMLDYIQDFDRVNPDWEDTLRPSRIPTDDGAFGGDGQASLSAKQSRFGIKATLPTAKGPINTKFEIDMFGVGEDAAYLADYIDGRYHR